MPAMNSVVAVARAAVRGPGAVVVGAAEAAATTRVKRAPAITHLHRNQAATGWIIMLPANLRHTCSKRLWTTM